MKIVLAGGGTGGHLTPLVAVARKIKEKVPEAEFVFVGPKGKLEKDLIESEGVKIRNISVGKLRRYFSFQNVIDILFKVPIGIIQCLFILLSEMPDAIFSKGGYASFPVVIVGWLYRIPIMIHESDANPGLANSMLGKFCDRVAVSYSEAEVYFPADQVVHTGSPIREDINRGNAQAAREKFHLTESKKVIFVWGGSQGARNINNRILDILPELMRRYQIIHQTGELNYEESVKKAGEMGFKSGYDGYVALPFISEGLGDILALADLVISRAGSTSISEIAANGKPAIIIPLENSANDHQRMNAYSLAKAGACVILEESNLGENMLMRNVDDILDDEELNRKLSENIKRFYHPDAAERIADGILGMVK